MNPIPNTFSWSIQKSGSDPKQAYLKGKVSYLRFVDFFNHFPWWEELLKANQNPNLSFPSISVKHIQSDHYLWVSAHGHSESMEFLVGYIFPKKIRKFGIFSKTQRILWERIYGIDKMEYVLPLFNYFFNGNFKTLEKELNNCQMYGDQEIKEIIH